MQSTNSINRYLEALSTRRSQDGEKKQPVRPFLTISRQTGAGGHTVGEKIAKLLNAEPHKVPWTMFDKELVEEVRKQHNLPENIGRYMTESSASEVSDYIGEMLGLHPSSFELVQKTNKTIVTLARMGKVIIVGRGGNLLTKGMKGSFHVRLVAPVEWRLQYLQDTYELSEKDAAAKIKETDKGRQKYIKDNFDADVDDAVEYDCVINTGLVSFDAAAAMIAGHLKTLY
jgi:cytidylate kinase